MKSSLWGWNTKSVKFDDKSRCNCWELTVFKVRERRRWIWSVGFSSYRDEVLSLVELSNPEWLVTKAYKEMGLGHKCMKSFDFLRLISKSRRFCCFLKPFHFECGGSTGGLIEIVCDICLNTQLWVVNSFYITLNQSRLSSKMTDSHPTINFKSASNSLIVIVLSIKGLRLGLRTVDLVWKVWSAVF